jgi:hypothetical protein
VFITIKGLCAQDLAPVKKLVIARGIIAAIFLCVIHVTIASGQNQTVAIPTAPVTATAFRGATGADKLAGLRAYKAAQKGAAAIEQCPGMSGTPPLPPTETFNGYYDSFGANFDVTASFGDTGANGIPSAQNSIQTEALGLLQFESEHFFYNYGSCLSHRPTISFGGTVGIVPALVMENLSSTTATIAIPMNRPMYQDAFGWTLGPKVNIATSHLSQAAVFVTLGEKYLISQVTSFKQGDDTITATPVSNNVGQSAMYSEVGFEWKYLNTDIANAYLNKTDVLSPPFTVAVGYKDDTRFKRAGDLGTFTNPEARLFFRFSVGLNKIGNWSGDQVDPGKGYTFRFGVDYEKPLGDSKMPTATRYYVSANLDVMKIFKPSAQ